MVNVLDKFKVAAGVALITVTPVAEAFADATCKPADVVCTPFAPTQPDGYEGGAPRDPPTTVQVLVTGTGTDTAMPPGRGLTWAMQDDAPYHRNQSAVWRSVRS